MALDILCRLCLEATGCIEIFQSDRLADNIFLVTTVKVSSLDPYPQKLCENCYDIIQLTIAFRDSVILNDKQIKNIITDQYLETKPSLEPTVSFNVVEHIKEERNDELNNSVCFVGEYIPQDIKSKTKFLVPNLEEPQSSKNVTITEDFKPSKLMKFEDEPDFMCDICPKIFTTAKKLYCHRRVHNRIHECKVVGCTKRFATRGDLRKHIRTHTGEKPFVCDMCSRKFAQNVTLKFHKESVHGVLSDTCIESKWDCSPTIQDIEAES
ncbi:unnamed protein product [Leptosia nina]|uniref:Uncharacterized protein n=1 Tax=Leptosia nina TaxID=320188 RepID=A0AAV1IZH4_9NEOP